MLATTDTGTRGVAQVLIARREMIQRELRTLDQTIGFYSPEKSVETAKVPAKVHARKLGPSAAILEQVTAHPGLPLKDAVNGALAQGVNSKAKDVKHMLRNTVDVLLKRGALVRLDGKLYPPPVRAD